MGMLVGGAPRMIAAVDPVTSRFHDEVDAVARFGAEGMIVPLPHHDDLRRAHGGGRGGRFALGGTCYQRRQGEQ